MNKLMMYVCVLFLLLGSTGSLKAQDLPTEQLTDNIQVDVKAVRHDTKTDSLTVDLFLISYSRKPREFKLNTYASQVFDAAGKGSFYSLIKMGRVQIRLEERQNYLHYLLEEEVPVSLTFKVANWGKRKATKLLLVFEDSEEEGHFIQKEVNL